MRWPKPSSNLSSAPNPASPWSCRRRNPRKKTRSVKPPGGRERKEGGGSGGGGGGARGRSVLMGGGGGERGGGVYAGGDIGGGGGAAGGEAGGGSFGEVPAGSRAVPAQMRPDGRQRRDGIAAQIDRRGSLDDPLVGFARRAHERHVAIIRRSRSMRVAPTATIVRPS